MLSNNVGGIDRILRIVVGLALIAWFFVDQGTGFWHWAKLIGIVQRVRADRAVGAAGLSAIAGPLAGAGDGVGINDIAAAEMCAYLFEYDSVFGPWRGT
jgi:hypothetical protein